LISSSNSEATETEKYKEWLEEIKGREEERTEKERYHLFCHQSRKVAGLVASWGEGRKGPIKRTKGIGIWKGHNENGIKQVIKGIPCSSIQNPKEET